jgi:hypothetical protein
VGLALILFVSNMCYQCFLHMITTESAGRWRHVSSGYRIGHLPPQAAPEPVQPHRVPGKGLSLPPKLNNFAPFFSFRQLYRLEIRDLIWCSFKNNELPVRNDNLKINLRIYKNKLFFTAHFL